MMATIDPTPYLIDESEPLPEGPKWRILHPVMCKMEVGDLFRYEDIGTLLRVDFLDPEDRRVIGGAAHGAARRLEREEGMIFVVSRGHGFERATPYQVLGLARRHQRRALAEVDRGYGRVETIDLAEVDTPTATFVRATLLAFGRQQAMMTAMDVRQQRLAQVMDAMSATVQSTAARVDGVETALQTMRERLQTLERHRYGEPQ